MNINRGNKIISDIIIYNQEGNGYNFKYVLDTGSDITFISQSVFNYLKLKSNSSGTIRGGDKNESSVKLTNVNITLPGHSKYIYINVGVLPDREGFDVIFGMDLISYCNIEIKTNSNGINFDIELTTCK